MINYFREVRSELKHVSWPTRRLTAIYTAVVLGLSLAVAVYLGLVDYVLSGVVQWLIS